MHLGFSGSLCLIRQEGGTFDTQILYGIHSLKIVIR